MFGKPEWFREKRVGWGVVPIAWQGWGYALAWVLVLGGPFVALLVRQQVVESLIWLAAAMTTLLWDVRQIRRAKRAVAVADVFYIGDEETEAERVATKNYDFQLRR